MSHHLSFHNLPPQNKSEGGYRIKATKSNFPVLQNMSFYKLILNERGVREPHWHANADELGYCLKGKVRISLYSNKNVKETFILNTGNAFFIPSGALHSIENIGNESAEIILQFSHEEPEEFSLSSTFNMFSKAVLGNTWNVPASHFNGSFSKDPFIVILEKKSDISNEEYYSSPYKYELEQSQPLIMNQDGEAKVARNNIWPILLKQALYSLTLRGTGMREPHWHPETAELGYVAQGKGRMSILSPSGKIDTYIMNEGDIYFIPKAYPHHIENLEETDLRLLIYFDQSMPEDIGFTASVKSNRSEILAKIMGCEEQIFKNLPQYYEDLFIVNKKNPLD